MAWSDIQVGVESVSGDSITLSATNPTDQAVAARLQVGVALAGGGTAVLRSQNLSFAAHETKSVTLHANGTIVAIDDDPVPIPPT